MAIFSNVRGKIQRYFTFISLSPFSRNSRLFVNCQQSTALPNFIQTRQTIQQLVSGHTETRGHGNHMSFCIRLLLLRKQSAKCEIEKAFNGVTFVKTFWFRTWHGHCTHACTHTHTHTHTRYEVITSLKTLTSKNWLKVHGYPQAHRRQLIGNSRLFM